MQWKVRLALLWSVVTLAAAALPGGGHSLHAAPGYVHVQDANNLGVDGRTWRAKIVQFWMTDYVTGPPGGWYNTWLAPQDAHYLAQARWEIASLAKANLNANTLRIFFPFGNVTDEAGNFLPIAGNSARTTLDNLEQVLAIATDEGLKYTIVLFNPDSCGFETGCWSLAHERFVTVMAQHFRNDPHLAWWGTVNEINDRNWGERDATNPATSEQRLNWNWRIATTLRTHDPNHLVSTSIQTDAGDSSGTPPPTGGGSSAPRYQDYFRPVSWEEAGTLASMVDFLTPHTFVGKRELVSGMIRGLRSAAPAKPIVLEETGWPTGGGGVNPQFSEDVQAAVVDAVLSAAAGDASTPATAGAGVWMLVDFNGLPDSSDVRQPHFGLFWSAYTATHDPSTEIPPRPWTRKKAAAVVQHYFTNVWAE